MPRRAIPQPLSFPQEAARAFLVNDEMNQIFLEHLDVRAWRAKPPGQRVRTIADMFAHVHNVRRKWLRLSAPHLNLPGPLDRRRCTQKQARAALAQSALRCSEMLEEALTDSSGQVQSFLRDGWARPWRPGAAMFAYMISHDAHHRGQACMLSHQLGFRLPAVVTSRMWTWESLASQCSLTLASAPKTKPQTGIAL